MKNTSSTRIIGIDLGDRKHAVCILNADGTIKSETSIPNDREDLRELSKKNKGALIALEFGMHSPWIW